MRRHHYDFVALPFANTIRFISCLVRDSVTGQHLQNGFIEFETTPQATEVLDSFADSDVFKLAYARPKRERKEQDRRPRRYDNGNNNDRQRGGSYSKRDWQPRD